MTFLVKNYNAFISILMESYLFKTKGTFYNKTSTVGPMKLEDERFKVSMTNPAQKEFITYPNLQWVVIY